MRKTAANVNPVLVTEGKIERFPQIRPGTGKRGRPGKLRLNDLPSGDVLYLDEITGLAVQGPANLSRDEAFGVVEIETEVIAVFGDLDEIVLRQSEALQ